MTRPMQTSTVVMERETSISDAPPPPYEAQQTFTPNVLVVGETGSGKSSVINLIAGEQVAQVSSSADGCTMDAKPYDVVLSDSQSGATQHVRLFDTVGMNEPKLAKNNYFTAIQKANDLISKLQRTGGIRLLIFCIRGGRITTVMQTNYHLFRHVLCQDQVPVAFVVTGMENEQPMESWWQRNEGEFKKSKLSCTSHVCITAARGYRDVYARQYEESQAAIRRMLLGHMTKTTSWRPMGHRNWFVHLASRLLRWVESSMEGGGKRTIKERMKSMSVDELARNLEHKCRFTREDAKALAKEIWVRRTEEAATGIVKAE